MTEGERDEDVQRGRPPQFRLSALLWLMATIGIALAYLRWFDVSDVHMCLQMTIASPLIGALVGAAARRLWDAIYWAMLGALLTFVCIVGYRFVHASFPYAWALVGALAGSIAGVVAPGKPLRRMLAGGVAGAAVMGPVAAAFVGLHGEAAFDVVCAVVVGALLAAMIEVIYWVERRDAAPRYITAAGLLLAVIGGNVIARMCTPYW